MTMGIISFWERVSPRVLLTESGRVDISRDSSIDNWSSPGYLYYEAGAKSINIGATRFGLSKGPHASHLATNE